MASVRKHHWIYKGEAKWAWVCEYTDPKTRKCVSACKSDPLIGVIGVQN